MIHGIVASEAVSSLSYNPTLQARAIFSGDGQMIVVASSLFNPTILFSGLGQMSVDSVIHPLRGTFFFAGSGNLLASALLNPGVAFSKTLGTSGSMAANKSFRQIVTPIATNGNFVSVSFKAGNSSYSLAHASVGVQTSTYNTSSTPVELLFGGASGFSISAGVTIASDWAALPFSSSDNLIVIGDAGSGGGAEAYTTTGVTGCDLYTKVSTDSYNVASPGGTWVLSSNTDIISKIESST